MRRILTAVIIAGLPFTGYAQVSFVAKIKDKKTNEVLPGAVVHVAGTSIGCSSDIDGVAVLTGVPAGKQAVVCKYVGFKERTDSMDFPQAVPDTITLLMESAADDELEEVSVSSTRSSRTIADMPTRVELIAGEELEEKANMKPGDIRMLLAESTGIQTQQTSATSANSSIRIQGLDGRYTQILKDGFPLYTGAASGLGLLQTPPLDLKQVEVIKGSASTLYGGGAIAGLVNLISKTPKEERELRFHINGTSAGGLDINAFYGKRLGKVGVTVFAASNSSSLYDPAGIGLTAIPRYERYTVNPKLFLYLSKKTTIVAGVNVCVEDRIGGDVKYIRGEGDSVNSFYESNKSKRFSTQFSLVHAFNDKSQLTIKNSYSFFDRLITSPGYTFDGAQNSIYSEVNYAHHTENFEWVAGGNFLTDGFSEVEHTVISKRNYIQNTVGVFVQNTWKVNKSLFVESGLRYDYVNNYGASLLPRVSILYKAGYKFSSRLGGGFGYKAPTLFTEESEKVEYRNVLSLNPSINKMEHSYGANWDLNYRTSILKGKVSLSVNHLFYYTYLKDPLSLVAIAGNITQYVNFYQFQNLTDHVDAKGMESNIKLGYKDFKLFLGYTYTDAGVHTNSVIIANPLTCRNRINSVLVYEVEDKIKLGLEAYYFSPQKLSDGTKGRDYWLMGFMAERLWKHFSLYINFENFLDVRQTKFETIYTGPISRPVFRDIYAPLDGFVVNGGVKIRL